MKKQEPIATQMDEIVFEHRNKNYGAYILRKMYNRQIVRALFLSTAVMIAGLAYPLALSYKAIHQVIHIGGDGGTTVIMEPPPLTEPPVVPPPPPDLEIKKQFSFTPPIVVEGEVPEVVGLNMEDLNSTSVNIPIAITEETFAAPKEKVIEIVDNKPPEVFVEEMPTYSGGDAERQKFLTSNIKYPQQAIETGVQGTVYVQFIVDSKGNITDVKMLRGIGGGCDDEAVRIVKMMPQWKPGKQNGKTVRVLFTMPVVFKLQG